MLPIYNRLKVTQAKQSDTMRKMQSVIALGEELRAMVEVELDRY